MKNFPLFLLCFSLCSALYGNTTLPKNTPPGCDTLIGTDGQVLLVRIKSQTKTTLKFFFCEDTLGRLYSMQKDLVRSIKHASDKSQSDSIPSTGKNYAISDTCDLITLTDGKQYYIRILDQDQYNYFYMICGDVDDRVYMMSYKRVRSLKRAPKRADGRKRTRATISGMGCLIALGAVALGLLAISFIAILLGD